MGVIKVNDGELLGAGVKVLKSKSVFRFVHIYLR